MTCALKNMKGLIPNEEKRRFHALGLHRPIASLRKAIRQDFIVVDHICGDPYSEDGGHPVTKNCIMAGMDPALIDAYACRALGLSPEDVPYLVEGAQYGETPVDLSENAVDIITIDDRGNIADKSGNVEAFVKEKLVEVSDVVEEVESCSACYAALIPALERLAEEGLLEKLNDTIAIGQGFRGKTGKLGAGDCTEGFCYHIAGCPPDEDEIYEGLKMYISDKYKN